MALTVQHLSIRVPWHEQGWDGTVCANPKDNASCLVLARIGAERRDDQEELVAGRHLADLQVEGYRPPCLQERGTFMSSRSITRFAAHPYTSWSKAHASFRPTRVEMLPYSAEAVPFRWLLRSEVANLADRQGVPYTLELEDAADQLMGTSSTAWVQDARNHKAIFEHFYRDVVIGQSLVFFYAKRTPLSDHQGRVLVGAALIDRVKPAREYEYDGSSPLRSMYWETSIGHSLRPDGVNGVLMPYQALVDAVDDNPALEVESAVAFAPDDDPIAFSYTTEHVSNDLAIDALLRLDRALTAAGDLLVQDVGPQRGWIDEQLNRLWTLRGPYPGLGSALTAFGVSHGSLVAYALSQHLQDGDDPWELLEKAFASPSAFGPDVAQQLSPSICRKWQGLREERKQLLRLLARFAVPAEAVERFWSNPDERLAAGLPSDADVLANPFRLAEASRWLPAEQRIPVTVVDRGVFPDEPVATQFPLGAPSAMDDGLDERRVRGLLADRLDAAAEDDGHTLLTARQVVGRVHELPLRPACPLDSDGLDQLTLDESDPVVRVNLSGSGTGYQLDTYVTCGALIRKAVERRLRGKRHSDGPDFVPLLGVALPALPDDPGERAQESRARTEKLSALTELFASRISVLVGAAGTGKTTLLQVLCSVPAVSAGGILLLAPTGKARVRLENAVRRGRPDAAPRLTAQTIAQFLIKRGRYVGDTGEYRVTGDSDTQFTGAKTVIIDESSMLTEDQLAATLDALAGVERLILVGDSRQLPPIGAGRPFVDIVHRLGAYVPADAFPHVGQAFAELLVPRRQVGEYRPDLLLASWFGGQPDPDADAVWDSLRAGKQFPSIAAVPWNRANVEDVITRTLITELHLDGAEDSPGFETACGGDEYQGSVYFHPTRGDRTGAGSAAERWQILTPVRARAWGTTELNRSLQRRFRARTRESAVGRWRKVPEPWGPEEIVYGDKVINVVNRQRRCYPHLPDGEKGYVANGEIGIVTGQFKSKKANYKGLPWKVEVEFSTQLGHAYEYKKISRDSDTVQLELAYAITVHKSQGSEFDTTFVVLPASSRGISRELMYTALTRQRERVVLLYEGDLGDLRVLSSPARSAITSRLTNLFSAPDPIEVLGSFMESSLVHRTRRGVLVRSKNEVIIADLLESLGLTWDYEIPFPGANGEIRLPDFTIEDPETGEMVLWEHLGMLNDPAYAAGWQRKLAWYQANGVTTDPESTDKVRLLVTDDSNGADSRAWERSIRRMLDL